MEFTLPKPDAELAAQLKDAPAGRQIVRAVTGMLQTLLRLDGGTGLVISTMRLAELARIKDLPAPEPLKKSAQIAAQLVAAFRQREYPKAFSRKKGEAYTDRLQIESLAEQIVEKTEDLERRVDSAREAAEEASEDERKRYEDSFRALDGAWEFLHHQVLHDFYTELKRRLGEKRFEHIRRHVRQLPAGAGSVRSLSKPLKGPELMGAEGGYRRAMIYGM